MPRRQTSAILDRPAHRNRTSPNGTIRFDRDLTRIGVGRLQMSSGTADPREFEIRNAIITRLVERHEIDTLIALRKREISIEELVAAQKKGRLTFALADAQERRSARTSAAPRISATDGLREPVSTVSATTLAGSFPAPHATLGTFTAPAERWPEESLPLWKTLNGLIGTLDCGPDTQRRYKTSLAALRRKLTGYAIDPGLEKLRERQRLLNPGTDPQFDYAHDAVTRFHALGGGAACVGDLRATAVSAYWESLQRQWGRSAADWNHMRRALSATLTGLFGYPQHPVRQRVIHQIPLAAEGEGRVPTLTPEKFWEVIDHMENHAKPGVMVLVLTGMRLKEYETTTREHLKPEVHDIDVPGTKTDGSKAPIHVDPRWWDWIEAGIPAPLKRRWLGIYWRRACKAAGLTNVRLHDLRHCYAQWTTDEGAEERLVGYALRHKDPAMTRRYTRTKGRRDVARTQGKVLMRARARSRKAEEPALRR